MTRFNIRTGCAITLSVQNEPATGNISVKAKDNAGYESILWTGILARNNVAPIIN